MIDSIDPTYLMDFSLRVMSWAVNDPNTLEGELDQIVNTIHTFCVNRDDPIYKGVDILCQMLIDTTKKVAIIDLNSEQPAQPEVEEEVKDGDRPESINSDGAGLQQPSGILGADDERPQGHDRNRANRKR
jgi:hypothetical protein